MSYRQAESLALKLFVIALFVFIAVHTYGVIRAVHIQSPFAALDR